MKPNIKKLLILNAPYLLFVYYGIDEDMRDRLQAKLMRAVLDYKID